MTVSICLITSTYAEINNRYGSEDSITNDVLTKAEKEEIAKENERK